MRSRLILHLQLLLQLRMAREGRAAHDSSRRTLRKVMGLIRGLCLAAAARADHLVAVQQHISHSLSLFFLGLRHEELGYG